MSEQEAQKQFEVGVRQIAHHLFPSAIGGGAEIIDGKERDGIFHTDEAIHIIEATVSKSKEKAIQDGKKIYSLIENLKKQYPDKAIKGWFVTKDEPTPDQRTVINKYNSSIYAVSFSRFQSRLIEVASYFNVRGNYPFGSVRDPRTGSFEFKDQYINVSLWNESAEKFLSTKDVSLELVGCNKILVMGHYGVGKSMAMNKIYNHLRHSYEKKQINSFPVYINLRDHQGQMDPVEVFYRHSRNIGFSNPDHLVRAWRAGYVILILDGFDEMALLGWAGKALKLKDIRYKSMELIRKFINEQPAQAGLIVSGRLNYFDSFRECSTSLGISNEFTILKIGDFTQDQIAEYLKNNSLSTDIPEWIPTRPLLLSYLVSKGIFSQSISTSGITDISEGWDYLLNKISEREAMIEAGLEPRLIREIIESLASIARKNQSGLGPITQDDLEKVFYHKCNYEPDDRALVLLQRLPGLTPQDQQDGSRYFIDNNFAEAAKAGDIGRYILNPFEYKMVVNPNKWYNTLDDIGIQVACHLLPDKKDGILEIAIIRALDDECHTLAADIVSIMSYLSLPWKRERIEIKDVLISSFELKNEIDWSKIVFKECIFQEMIVEEKPLKKNAPVFDHCIIGRVVGCNDFKGAKDDIFFSCDVESFESQKLTTSSLLSIDQPTPVIVCLTILKKLYYQAGSGRQENAFYRGLSQKEQRYVQDVLEILKQKGLVLPPKKSSPDSVWQPVRSQKDRVKQILLNRSFSDDLILKLKNMI